MSSDKMEKRVSKEVSISATLAPYFCLIPDTFAKSLGGALGGVVEASCLQPIDVVKTRLQLDKKGYYKSIPNCFHKIYQEEGMRSLWKGLTPFATHLFLKYALRFGSNAVFENLFRKKDGSISSIGILASGMGAGITEALLVVTPFEVIKITLQKQKGMSLNTLKYKGPIHAASMIIREEGLLGLWKGSFPTVLRNGTNQMSLFYFKPFFDKLLWHKEQGDGKALKTGQSFTSGFFAALIGPCITGPFDVAKTRLMAQENDSGRSGGHRYHGFFHCIKKIYYDEGIKSLWKGLLPRLMRIPPGQAIVWMVRDQIVQFIEKEKAMAKQT